MKIKRLLFRLSYTPINGGGGGARTRDLPIDYR